MKKTRLTIDMRLLSNEISRKWQVASLSEYRCTFWINFLDSRHFGSRYTWPCTTRWFSYRMRIVYWLVDMSFCTLICSLRLQPWLSLRHVSNNKIRCETREELKSVLTKFFFFAQKWNFAGFLAPFGRRCESTRSYIRSQLYSSCRDFTPRRFVSYIVVCFYVQTIRTSPLVTVLSWYFAV